MLRFSFASQKLEVTSNNLREWKNKCSKSLFAKNWQIGRKIGGKDASIAGRRVKRRTKSDMTLKQFFPLQKGYVGLREKVI